MSSNFSVSPNAGDWSRLRQGLIPEPVAIDEAYRQHRLGRHLVPGINVPLMLVSAVGQYRINCAALLEEPQHRAFGGFTGSIYDEKTYVGKLARRIFLGGHSSNHLTSSENAASLRQSGARLNRFAGYGLQPQLALRLAINITALRKMRSANNSGTLLEKSSMVVDTGSVTAHIVEAAAYNAGLSRVVKGVESSANSSLLFSQRLGFAGGAFQFGAGAMRFSHEWMSYEESGKWDPSALLYSSIDMASGASGMMYTRLLLNQAAKASTLSSQNNVLMHVVEIGSRFQWGLRIVGVAGAAFGLVTNAITYYQSDDKTASVIGMAGSSLLVASGLMVASPLAPVAACTAAVGVGLLVGQSLYQYRNEIGHFLDSEKREIRGHNT